MGTRSLMEDWNTCPICNFARETLVELPCCRGVFCSSCVESRALCPKCFKAFDINKCFELTPMKKIVGEVLVECKYPNCDYKSTSLLIHQHQASCKHATILEGDLAEALMGADKTPKALMIQRQKNIFTPFMMYNNVAHILSCIENNLPLDTTPLPNSGADDGHFTHTILESDTLAGLAVKYGVSVAELKETNRLNTEQIHERTALRIPCRTRPVFTEADAKGLEKLLLQRLINRFRRRTSIKSNEEALFYLENVNMDMDAAFAGWIADNDWEKTAPPFQSCIPVKCAHEELDLFERVQKRGCCYLVF